MHPATAFDECYPPEIVEWINAFPAPDLMTGQQLQITRTIDDPRAVAAAQDYFSTLNECDTPEEGNAMITRFRAPEFDSYGRKSLNLLEVVLKVATTAR